MNEDFAKHAEREKKKASVIGGYAGFVCAACGVPVDADVRGNHHPECPSFSDSKRLWRREYENIDSYSGKERKKNA